MKIGATEEIDNPPTLKDRLSKNETMHQKGKVHRVHQMDRDGLRLKILKDDFQFPLGDRPGDLVGQNIGHPNTGDRGINGGFGRFDVRRHRGVTIFVLRPGGLNIHGVPAASAENVTH
jgi:hypothetical protein